MTLRPRVRHFPWHTLAHVERAEVSALRSLRRWASAHVPLGAFSQATQDIVGGDVEILLGRLETGGDLVPWPDSVGAVLGLRLGDRTGETIVVEVESALAAALVARALRRPARVPLAAPDTRSPSLAGALGALLVACARRAVRDHPLRLLAAGAAAELGAALAGADLESRGLVLTVLLDRNAFAARVVLAGGFVHTAPSPTWDRTALSSLGASLLSLPIVAAIVRMSAAELASLAPGDALLPGRSWSVTVRGGTLVGPVHLAAPASDLAVRAELVEGARLVLRGEPEGLGDMRDKKADPEQADALVENVGEVPVVVRVEIGEATMAAREWAGLGKGDVIELGRKVGEHVVLRVGGVPVATGELVEVDGELGVRIVARISSQTSRG